MNDKISIIIPIYNVEKYLHRCLNSCLNQSYTNIEVICVNDGSTDSSLNIIEYYCEIDPRFIHLKKDNEGLPWARKSGLEIATGKYVFHLDGDDYLPLNAIENLYQIAIKDQSDVVIGAHMMVYDDLENALIDTYDFELIDSVSYIKNLLVANQFFVWGKLILRDLYCNIEIPKDISYTEDVIAMIQVAYYATKISKCQNVVYYYYQRNGSFTHKLSKKNLLQWYKSNEYVFNFLKNKCIINLVYEEFRCFYYTQLSTYVKFINITGEYRGNIKPDLLLFQKERFFKSINFNKTDVLLFRLAYISPRISSFLFNLYSSTVGYLRRKYCI